MFSAPTYVARRRELANQMPPGLVLLLGNEEAPMNYEANPYPFRQDSTFLYYTGLDQPGLALLIDTATGKCTLYGKDAGLDEVVWTGPKPSVADRAEVSGIGNTARRADLEADVQTAIQADRDVHVLPPYRDTHRIRLEQLLGVTADRSNDFASKPLIRAVVAQRSVKSNEEIRQLTSAVEVTKRMHETAMLMAQPGRTEQEIAAKLSGLALTGGGELSFPITCSVRGEVLHNHHYANPLLDEDLLLVDTGATSPMHYAADVTRVAPVSGTFSDRQRAVYRAVLDAQETAIAACTPGTTFREIHLTASRVLTEHLIDIGLMNGPVEDAVEAGAHALFFPHGLGHMLGLDVHDMENLGEDFVGYSDDVERSDQFGLNALRLGRELESGFVVTVEPGCYFIPQLIARWRDSEKHADFINYDVATDFIGFGGIRIEDDVHVTADGPEIIGPPIAKSIDEVESLASQRIEIG
ncbi:Xaa-Pro aminopeptidase [Longibacter salinarum]|uniref:Xaa-Pro aminopeptidase n=1 Tax=Longibacter salinarum TaxID=1850348 RepID=A0A2A8D367_9BACT|nr:aminopeptidase P family protein [Longibacter salinarum]PEN15396.1 Xaa-Pro aminopeptidase [Longibacter salinarum]